MPGTNCGLFFRVIPKNRNFMVSVKSSKWGLYNWNMKLKNPQKLEVAKRNMVPEQKQRCPNNQNKSAETSERIETKQNNCKTKLARQCWLAVSSQWLHLSPVISDVRSFRSFLSVVLALSIDLSKRYQFSSKWTACLHFWQWKNYDHIWKNEVCMQINAFWARWCGECDNVDERHNHQQSFTTASRQGHILVKVLALRYTIPTKIKG